MAKKEELKKQIEALGGTVTVHLETDEEKKEGFAEGGRATTASIFGEAGAEWAIPEAHTNRTADLLNAARAASGFTWGDLISRYGGLKQMDGLGPSGETIIDRVIDTMREESNYLNEAKNLAAFHHEKWDGTGYPKGLKGEEIPLSARVMAVADVFDALVSRRCYKSPYPVEKSLEIIRESSGTHFDPLVVKAFLDAEDEVRQVASLNLDSYDYKQHNL